jgi:hypothetical protein
MKWLENLFGTPAFKLVRRNDPITSFEAAVKIDTTKMEQMVYEAIAGFGSNGCISDEVLEKFPNFPYSTVTARYKSLVDKGFVEIVGVREGKSGRKQRIMKVVK